MTTPLYRDTCRALRALAPQLAARPEMQTEWVRAGMSQAEAARLLEQRFASESTCQLGDLLTAHTPAQLEARDRAAHMLDGKRYEQLAPSAKHALMLADRERFLNMQRDWQRRGKPIASEPESLIDAIASAARAAGVDTSDRATHLRVVQ